MYIKRETMLIDIKEANISCFGDSLMKLCEELPQNTTTIELNQGRLQ